MNTHTLTHRHRGKQKFASAHPNDPRAGPEEMEAKEEVRKKRDNCELKFLGQNANYRERNLQTSNFRKRSAGKQIVIAFLSNVALLSRSWYCHWRYDWALVRKYHVFIYNFNNTSCRFFLSLPCMPISVTCLAYSMAGHRHLMLFGQSTQKMKINNYFRGI